MSRTDIYETNVADMCHKNKASKQNKLKLNKVIQRDHRVKDSVYIENNKKLKKKQQRNYKHRKLKNNKDLNLSIIDKRQ